jgi:hypothetical protein
MIWLSAQRREVLLEVTQRSPGLSCQGDLGAFLDRYLVAEALARKVVSYYQDDTKKPSSNAIQVQQLSAAIRHFGIIFSESDTRTLFFGGEGLRGKKSARQLRNGYIHSLSAEDRVEIEQMAPLLIEMLNGFINASCAFA